MFQPTQWSVITSVHALAKLSLSHGDAKMPQANRTCLRAHHRLLYRYVPHAASGALRAGEYWVRGTTRSLRHARKIEMRQGKKSKFRPTGTVAAAMKH